MGDVEHVSRLRSGVRAWNAWRIEHPGVRPDLAGEDLHCVELDGVDLRHANLARSDLTHAFFHEADLCDADLSKATLVGTNFCLARLAAIRREFLPWQDQP